MNTPQSMQMVMWISSDHTLPRSSRMIEGFWMQSFRLINAAGESTFVKFHWRPEPGLQSPIWDEIVKLSGANPDFHLVPITAPKVGGQNSPMAPCWQPMVNGYSSLVPPLHEKLYRELYEFPTETGLSELERMGVNYVIVHTDMYQPDRWAGKEKALASFPERIRLLRVEGEGRAYAIGRR